MDPRLWSIAVHVHNDATITARVHVEGRLLLPTCESQTLEQALGYVAAVLVDYRERDRLALRKQGAAGTDWNLGADSPQLALGWLRERLTQSTVAEAPTAEGHRSGTRPVLRASDTPQGSQSANGSCVAAGGAQGKEK